MPDVIKLIDTICSVYDNPDYAPVYNNGILVKTFCNFATNAIAVAMGCDDLYDTTTKLPKTADEIADLLAQSKDWIELHVSDDPQKMPIDYQAIQLWANKGELVFAVLKSTDLKQEHGHICVVRPGLLKSSGKWGDCPAVMNIGGENFIALGKSGVMKGRPVGVNEAFQPIPKFYVWNKVSA